MNLHCDYAVTSKMLTRQIQNPHQAIHRLDAIEAHRSELQARTALKRFYRLYHLRNLLFRFTPGLANRLAL